MTLELVKNPDILRTLGERKKDQFLIGFAAETEELEKKAAHKLKSKNCDLIVANDVTVPGAGFGSDLNEVVVIGVPHEKWGEAVKACVSLHPGERLTLEDLQAHCKATGLANYKKPLSLDIVDEVPKTAVGKVFRRALRDRAFEITELSMGSHIVTTARGDAPYVGVPVFLSRAFRHSAIYIRTDRGIRSPADLAGRTTSHTPGGIGPAVRLVAPKDNDAVIRPWTTMNLQQILPLHEDVESALAAS